ncbi:hypothetical protein CPB85DRAFT_1255149 [Mucidula mucida]|nr:hypothetical protein CPB85DRAFT_1255149 [Mucidula mucida]
MSFFASPTIARWSLATYSGFIQKCDLKCWISERNILTALLPCSFVQLRMNCFKKWTVSQRHRNFLEPLIQQQPIRLRRQSSRTDSPVVDYCSPGRVKPFGKEKWRDNPAQYIQRTWAITNPAYGKIWAGFDGTLSALSSIAASCTYSWSQRAFPDTEEGANKKAKRTVRAKSGGKACATIILLEES